MNFELKNLKAYIVIVLSCLYATYTGSIFLENILGNLPIAILSSLTMGFIGHLYLIEGCKSLRQRKFSSNVLVAVLLCGILIFFDLKGVQDKNIADYIKPTIERHKSDRGSLNDQISAVSKVIQESASHTVNGKTNWALYNTYNKSSQQLKDLMASMEKLETMQRKELDEESQKTNEHTQYMSGISVVLVLLSILVSFSLEEEKTVQQLKSGVSTEPSKTLISSTKKQPVSATEIPTTPSKKPTVEEILKSMMVTTPHDQTTNNHYLRDYSTKDRMRIAVGYIQASGVTKHELLSKKFLLNFKQISIVKNLALEGGSKKHKNFSTKKVVGFQLGHSLANF